MHGAGLKRRTACLGLMALALGGCGLLGDKAPARLATISVQTSSRPAFVTAINRFAGVRHFQVKPTQLAAASATSLTLERADMKITLRNADQTASNPLAWQVTCYKSHSGSSATPAEIDEMADEFLANVLDVPGVQLISSDKSVTSASASAPSSAAASS